MPSPVPLLALAALLLGCTGCVRGCKSGRSPFHPNPNMDYQEKYEPQEASDFFYDGAAMRKPVPGTVARGELRTSDELHTGRSADGAYLAANPLAGDEALLARGESRYSIYCQPCHDKRGSGKGILYERGNVPTADLMDDKYRQYPDGQLFDVVTNGLGLMKGYRYPLPPGDRWAIVAHVRRLQREKRERELALAGGGGTP